MSRTVYTKASEIALHITGLLATISQANGYKTDIGRQVFRGKRKIDDGIPPCAVVIEGEDKPTSTQGPVSQKITQSYALGGYAECDPDHPNDRAHEILADIKKAIFTTDEPTAIDRHKGSTSFGGKVVSVNYRGRDIGPRADGVALVFAVVHIDVEFVEQLNDA